MNAYLPALLCVALLGGCSSHDYASRPDTGAPPADLNAWLTPDTPPDDGISPTRRQILTESGKTLGFRGGKAHRAWELIQALNLRESTLNALFDFRPLISPEGWLPPVIGEAQDVAHITPDQIRTASRVWTIVRPERFVSNPPGWRDWLLRGLSTSATPGGEARAVPQNSAQRRVMEAAIREGWEEGRENADLTLQANMNTLTRDYRGMMLWATLWRQGKITRPVVTDQRQTVTGDGSKMVTGEHVRRMKQRAQFDPDKTHWRPVVLPSQGPFHEKN
ncbi:type IV secretory system conjugative DNA transfer family protein [Klebsiella sp. PL-2018]|uniref:type IV secretory system conjugative DNA transfer family protein n=1 Tax=Klebsiella TaxID=570 RepID=UPI001C21220D|nr:type IV secretory system conjugative DNA transfer family protein [Klebsiella sp. PL-2018]QXD00980.1 IncI1 plasmid conjugative transfer protein TraI [Klebsiella sp. PL-2018]